MKLSVYTLACPEFTPAQAAAKVAALGMDGIEWRVANVPAEIKFDPRDGGRFWGANHATLPLAGLENAARAAAAITRDNGLETSFLAGGADPSDLDSVKAQMSAATILGAPAIRVGPGSLEGDHLSAAFDAGRRAWDGVEKTAAQMGVKAVVETHHYGLMPSASAARRFMEGRDPACCGVLYDPGNMAFDGYERPEYGLQMILPWLAHVHVKTARPMITGADERRCLQWGHRWCTLREGIVDWAGQIEALRKLGYDGYLSLEDFNPDTQAEEKLTDFADLFKELLAR